MTVVIVASQRDAAALNIADKLIRDHGFEQGKGTSTCSPCYVRGNAQLVCLDRDVIYADGIDAELHCEAIIFASRHKSDSGAPTLTTHVSGNPGSTASLGGLARRLALAHPQMLRSALVGLAQAARDLGLSEYSVSLEATHHGPTELGVPSMFVEIGSTEREWNDPRAGKAAAQAISSAVTTVENGPSAVGFGGGHYSMKHTRISLDGKYCVGHILPKYFFDNYDVEIVRLAFERTVGNCTLAVIDWKGIRGGERSRLLEDLKGLGINTVRT